MKLKAWLLSVLCWNVEDGKCESETVTGLYMRGYVFEFVVCVVREMICLCFVRK